MTIIVFKKIKIIYKKRQFPKPICSSFVKFAKEKYKVKKKLYI